MANNKFHAIIEKIKEQKFTIICSILGICGALYALGVPLMICGSAKLSEASKSNECGQDLQGALGAFSRDMGLPYQIGPDDYKSIFDKGEIQKEYFRDGIHYTAYFHLDKTDAGCNLKFYKRGQREPGRYTSTTGNYGSVVLKKCQCQ